MRIRKRIRLAGKYPYSWRYRLLAALLTMQKKLCQKLWAIRRWRRQFEFRS